MASLKLLLIHIILISTPQSFVNWFSLFEIVILFIQEIQRYLNVLSILNFGLVFHKVCIAKRKTKANKLAKVRMELNSRKLYGMYYKALVRGLCAMRRCGDKTWWKIQSSFFLIWILLIIYFYICSHILTYVQQYLRILS